MKTRRLIKRNIRKTRKYKKMKFSHKHRKTVKIGGRQLKEVKNMIILQSNLEKDLNLFYKKIKKKGDMITKNELFKPYIESKQFDLIQEKNKIENKIKKGKNLRELEIRQEYIQKKYDFLQKLLNEIIMEEQNKKEIEDINRDENLTEEQKVEKIKEIKDKYILNKYRKNPERNSFINSYIIPDENKEQHFAKRNFDKMESYLKKQKEYNTPEDNPIEKPEKLYGSLHANPGTTDSLINKENEAMFEMPQPQFRPPSYGYLSPPKYERLSPNSDDRTDVEGETFRKMKKPSPSPVKNPSPVIVNEPVVQRGDRMAAIREARL